MAVPLKGLYLQNNRAELLAILCVLEQAHMASQPTQARSGSEWAVTRVQWLQDGQKSTARQVVGALSLVAPAGLAPVTSEAKD